MSIKHGEALSFQLGHKICPSFYSNGIMSLPFVPAIFYRYRVWKQVRLHLKQKQGGKVFIAGNNIDRRPGDFLFYAHVAREFV